MSTSTSAARRFSRGTAAVYAKWDKAVQQDFFFKEAKKAGYVSRAAYKLKEIQAKHRIIKPGNTVLDLGCSPGAWMQVACQEIGPKERGGLVLGVDIQEVVVPRVFCDERVRVLQADARELPPSVLEQISPGGFDCVLSDMLHFTSGVNDVELSLELAGTALHIATGYHFDEYGEEYVKRMGFRHTGYLRPGGALVMKIYDGSGTTDFIRHVQRYFTKVVRMNVDASRSMSREFYAVGLGRKKAATPTPAGAAAPGAPAAVLGTATATAKSGKKGGPDV